MKQKAFLKTQGTNLEDVNRLFFFFSTTLTPMLLNTSSIMTLSDQRD